MSLTVLSKPIADSSEESIQKQPFMVRFFRLQGLPGSSASFFADKERKWFMKACKVRSRCRNEIRALQEIDRYFDAESAATAFEKNDKTIRQRRRAHFPKLLSYGPDFLVTEHVPGRSFAELAKRVKSRGLEEIRSRTKHVPTGAGLAEQLDEIVADLRAMRVCHCDVSKEEVFLDSNGCLVLVDFGNARVVEPDEDYDTIAKKHGPRDLENLVRIVMG